MTGFFAALDVVVGIGEFVEYAGRVLVGGVVEIPAFQDRDRGHTEVLDPGIVGKTPVGVLLFFVVVDVGIAGVPAAVGKIGPAVELDVDNRIAGAIDFERFLPGCVLGAPFDQDAVVAAARVEGELAVGVEKRLARPDLPHGIGRSDVSTIGRDHLHPCLHDLARHRIMYFTSDLWHDSPVGWPGRTLFKRPTRPPTPATCVRFQQWRATLAVSRTFSNRRGVTGANEY